MYYFCDWNCRKTISLQTNAFSPFYCSYILMCLLFCPDIENSVLNFRFLFQLFLLASVF